MDKPVFIALISTLLCDFKMLNLSVPLTKICNKLLAKIKEKVLAQLTTYSDFFQVEKNK